MPRIIKESSLLALAKDRANIPFIARIINPKVGRLKSESFESKMSLPTKTLYLTMNGKFASGTKKTISAQAAKLSKKENVIKYLIL